MNFVDVLLLGVLFLWLLRALSALRAPKACGGCRGCGRCAGGACETEKQKIKNEK